MDAIAFDLACRGEGMTLDGGRVILVPIANRLAILGEDRVDTWLRGD